MLLVIYSVFSGGTGGTGGTSGTDRTGGTGGTKSIVFLPLLLWRTFLAKWCLFSDVDAHVAAVFWSFYWSLWIHLCYIHVLIWTQDGDFVQKCCWILINHIPYFQLFHCVQVNGGFGSSRQYLYTINLLLNRLSFLSGLHDWCLEWWWKELL